jgi:hypothetical protein
MTAATAEPGTEPSRKPTLSGTLLPAEWQVKRNLPGFEAGEDQRGQARPAAPAIRAPACRQAGRIGNGECWPSISGSVINGSENLRPARASRKSRPGNVGSVFSRGSASVHVKPSHDYTVEMCGSR